MDKILEVDITDDERLNRIASALASPLRTAILKLLSVQSMSVNEIVFRLNVSKSTASVNIKILEEAGFVMTEYQAGKHGSMKLCSIANEKLLVDLLSARSVSDINTYTVDMPIGGYTDFFIDSPPCGLLTEDTFVGRDDNVGSFYCAERFRAQLLWFRQGYVEYKFPKEFTYRKIESIEFAFEACAEAPGYRMEYPSDITVWVNGKEIGTYVYPGDYGGRRGICTPAWWPLDSTQFGDYKRWKVTDGGTYVEDLLVSGVRVSDLAVEKQNYICFRLGIKADAKHIGGVNLFGEKFGDYPRNLTMTVSYRK